MSLDEPPEMSSQPSTDPIRRRLHGRVSCGDRPKVQPARTVLASVVVGCAVVVSACSATQPAPKVSKAELQKDISNRLAQSGAVPRSVVCPADLVGEVGTSIRCAVTTTSSAGTNNSFEPLVTVTNVEGTNVSYDVVPTESQSQLEVSVARQLAQTYQVQVNSVVCESGLDGKPGAVAHCAVTTKGVTLRRTVEVTSVAGFTMNYRVLPILTKEEAVNSLLTQLARVGLRPDSASCVDSLDGQPGNTVECTAVTRGNPETFILTVTSVTGNSIAVSYTRKP